VGKYRTKDEHATQNIEPERGTATQRLGQADQIRANEAA